MAVVVDVFTCVVCAALAWYSYEMVALAYEFEDVLLGDLPAWPFQAIMPVGFALIAYRYLVLALDGCVRVVTGEEPD